MLPYGMPGALSVTLHTHGKVFRHLHKSRDVPLQQQQSRALIGAAQRSSHLADRSPVQKREAFLSLASTIEGASAFNPSMRSFRRLCDKARSDDFATQTP